MASSPDERPVGVGETLAPPPSPHRRQCGWFAGCGLLVLVAGGLAIWALGLQSDLDDQRDQTAQAQQQAAQAGKQVASLSDQLDQMSQTVSDAAEQLSQAGDDAQDNAQAALDGLDTKLESLRGEVQQAADEAGASEGGGTP